MFDRKAIEDLIKLMVDHDLMELDLADGDQSITLRRAGAFAPPPAPLGHSPAPAAAASTHSGASAPASGGAAPGTVAIKSPMVGTYYSKANPDADPYVSAGKSVSDSTVVCLIEAMKVFNEIKAECRGTILEVLVKDGDAVEYNQPLFILKPA